MNDGHLTDRLDDVLQELVAKAIDHRATLYDLTREIELPADGMNNPDRTCPDRTHRGSQPAQ